MEGVSPTHLVGRGRLVLPAAQHGTLCPVDHPYRGPLLLTVLTVLTVPLYLPCSGDDGRAEGDARRVGGADGA
eukprot:1343362-Pyramimonas_sp.AAC.2